MDTKFARVYEDHTIGYLEETYTRSMKPTMPQNFNTIIKHIGKIFG